MSYAVEIRGLSFSYCPEALIFHDFSLRFAQGETVMLLGPNGCGKTTLLKCMAGLLKGQRGEILVSGRPLQAYSPTDLAKVIAYVAQNDDAGNEHLVRNYLVLGRAPYIGLFHAPGKKDYEIVEKYAVEFGVEHLLDMPIASLSGGQRQLIAVIRALIQETPLILMDEPAASLDLRNQVLLLSLIQKLEQHNRTVILSTHDPNHAYALKCQVVLLAAGELIGAGMAEDILSQENIFRVFGYGLSILQKDGLTGYALQLPPML